MKSRRLFKVLPKQFETINKLREKCPNTEFFLVRIFPYLDYFSLNAEKYGQEKTPYLGTVCNCKNSSFRNYHHSHILTRDLRIIQNDKFRKIISKGPNYREPKSVNWKKI